MAFFGRGKNRIQDPYTLTSMYARYIDTHTGIYNIEYKLFIILITEFYKGVMKEILYNSRDFNMPYRMGKIMVVKTPVNINHLNARSMDWKKAAELGKPVYHLNEHSSGYKYYFFWNKAKCIIKNAFYYRFIPTRTNKRYLAKLIKSGEYDYFEKG